MDSARGIIKEKRSHSKSANIDEYLHSVEAQRMKYIFSWSAQIGGIVTCADNYFSWAVG